MAPRAGATPVGRERYVLSEIAALVTAEPRSTGMPRGLHRRCREVARDQASLDGAPGGTGRLAPSSARISLGMTSKVRWFGLGAGFHPLPPDSVRAGCATRRSPLPRGLALV